MSPHQILFFGALAYLGAGLFMTITVYLILFGHRITMPIKTITYEEFTSEKGAIYARYSPADGLRVLSIVTLGDQGMPTQDEYKEFIEWASFKLGMSPYPPAPKSNQ